LTGRGIEIGQTSVAKYMARRRGPPSQGWKTFLRNHAEGIAVMDLFVVPTISFRLLYGLLIRGHGRRQVLWFGVTAHPTAEWIANQITHACGPSLSDPRLGRGLWRSLYSKEFDPWAFVIDRRRQDPPGKTDMLNGIC
jgi:hypothetical protein